MKNVWVALMALVMLATCAVGKTEGDGKTTHKWLHLAGNNYKYFMVFQTKEVEGAITV